MLKWILQDIKRSLLSRKTYILMLVVLMSIGGQFYMHNESNRVFDEDGVEIVYDSDPEADTERNSIFSILSEEINYVHSLAGSLSRQNVLQKLKTILVVMNLILMHVILFISLINPMPSIIDPIIRRSAMMKLWIFTSIYLIRELSPSLMSMIILMWIFKKFLPRKLLTLMN